MFVRFHCLPTQQQPQQLTPVGVITGQCKSSNVSATTIAPAFITTFTCLPTGYLNVRPPAPASFLTSPFLHQTDSTSQSRFHFAQIQSDPNLGNSIISTVSFFVSSMQANFMSSKQPSGQKDLWSSHTTSEISALLNYLKPTSLCISIIAASSCRLKKC